MKTTGTSKGFTIVELLIVVVVIAILAAITIVSYNGITARANDTSVQADLANMAKTVMVASTDTGVFPTNEATLTATKIHLSKGAYGNHLVAGGQYYNALYCSTVPAYSPAEFAFVAASKSGNVYVYKSDSGSVTTYPNASWTSGWGTICPDVLGVSAGNSGAGVWLYENSIWKSWL